MTTTTHSPSPFAAQAQTQHASYTLPSSSLPTPSNTSSQPTSHHANPTQPEFKHPPHTLFPPFYTLQPNLTTRASQLASWSSLITSYASHHRLFRLTTSHPIFANTRINRKLPPDDAREVLAYMVSKGRAEWLSSSSSSSSSRYTSSNKNKDKDAAQKEEVHLYWRSPEEWASLIQSWVENTGQRNAVVTFYELVEGDETRRDEFWGLPGEMARRAVGVLVGRGRAAVFGDQAGGGEGVKFFF